ncbi:MULTISPECIES: hypothetical protein [unclassified Paraburkholderia]|uniref:hypothetical protein n=1 Tax=unclassified Paraburkholderia TaxID=2615204 RepID=UPI002AB71266|nr:MULTISPECIES: hypothetical protein [unclassified Paraburkholderia]
MSKLRERYRAGKKPVNPDSYLAAIIERHRHLYVDIGMCMGVLVGVVCLVVAAHVIADWLNLAI